MGRVIVTGVGITGEIPNDFSFGDFPELAFALPYSNLSFERWDGTLPEAWVLTHDPADGTRAKYNPGFDSTRAIKISDTGVISAPENGLKQTIIPASYLNGQKIRAGMVYGNSLGAPAGDAQAVIAITQNSDAIPIINYGYGAVSENWEIGMWSSIADINTTYTDLKLKIATYSSGSATNPAALFDCLFAEYGRTTTERYYTFVRKPEFAGLDIIGETFVRSERTGVGKRRSWDPTGGAMKWKFIMPFMNIPGSMYEALYEFFRINKGLDDREGVHLVLHHKLIDINDVYNLHMPPWIVCDIAEKDWPFKPSGGWLGAKFYSGTLTFEEV